MTQKKIAVFGSGTVRDSGPEAKLAYELGGRLAQKGFVVVSGGYGGVMRAVSEGAKAGNGRTIGVTTDAYPDAEPNAWIDEEVRTPSWQERLHQLMELADGYVVMDGGTGTLTELLTAWEAKSKGFSAKPLVVLGARMRHLAEQIMKEPEVAIPGQFHLAARAEEAVQYLEEALVPS